MLVNLSNHPVSSWSPDQLKAAIDKFGEVTDLPFPIIEPHREAADVDAMVQEYVKKVDRLFRRHAMHVEQGYGRSTGDDAGETHPAEDGVHLMGETSFVVCFAQRWGKTAEPLYCSTTERKVVEMPDGTTQRQFAFVQFRWMPN